MSFFWFLGVIEHVNERIFLMNFLLIVAYYMTLNFYETNWPHIFLGVLE